MMKMVKLKNILTEKTNNKVIDILITILVMFINACIFALIYMKIKGFI